MLITADYHQGNESIFSDLSRGRQCVANCVVFLIKGHYEKCEFHNWSKHELHNVLHGGDLLYQKLRDLNDYDFLHPSCIPCHMKFDNANINYHISETCTGSISPNFKGVSPLFSLENALATISNGVKSKFMLFFCKGTAVGLVYHQSTFYLFDPHARDLNEMPSERGTCGLGIFNNITEICSFLRRLATSLCTLALTDIQFDLHSIDLCLIYRNRCKKCSARSICIRDVLNCSDDLSKKRKSDKETFHQGKRHKGLPSSIPLQEPEDNVNKDTSQSPIEYLSKRKRDYEAQCLKLTHGEYENQVEALIDSNLESVTDTTLEDMNIEFAENLTDFIENELNKLYTIFQSRIKDGPMYVCKHFFDILFV